MARWLSPGEDRPAEEGEGGVAHQEAGIHLLAGAQPVARIAGAVGGVEGEVPGLQLHEARAAVGTGVLLAVEMGGRLSLSPLQDLQDPVRGAQRRLHRVGDPGSLFRSHHQPIHHYGDVVVFVPGQLGGVAQVVDLAVHPDPDEALLASLLEEILELPLATADQGREDLGLRPLLELEDAVHDLRGRLPHHGPAAVGAVGHPGPGPEETEVVVDLGDRPHRGAGVVGDGVLLDGDRGREALDGVHVGLLHEAQELAGVGREGLHVAALAFGVDRVEGEGRLPRPGEARDHDQRLPGQLHVDPAEVVLPGAEDGEEVVGHSR